VTLAVSLSLVPALDAQGAAIATVAAELVLAGASVAALVRARPNLSLPLGTVPIAVVAGGLGVAIGHLVGVHPVLDVVIGTCVYALALAVLGRFPPEIGHALRAGRTVHRVE
jgi:hypothetical protein